MKTIYTTILIFLVSWSFAQTDLLHQTQNDTGPYNGPYTGHDTAQKQAFTVSQYSNSANKTTRSLLVDNHAYLSSAIKDLMKLSSDQASIQEVDTIDHKIQVSKDIRTSGIVLLSVGAASVISGGVGLIMSNVYLRDGVTDPNPSELYRVSLPIVNFGLPVLMAGAMMFGRGAKSLHDYSSIKERMQLSQKTEYLNLHEDSDFIKKQKNTQLLKILGIVTASIGVGLYSVWIVDAAMGSVIDNTILIPIIASGSVGGIAGGVMWGVGEMNEVNLYKAKYLKR